MEDRLAEQGRHLEELTAAEKDGLWEEAKQALHHQGTETRRRSV